MNLTETTISLDCMVYSVLQCLLLVLILTQFDKLLHAN